MIKMKGKIKYGRSEFGKWEGVSFKGKKRFSRFPAKLKALWKKSNDKVVGK